MRRRTVNAPDVRANFCQKTFPPLPAAHESLLFFSQTLAVLSERPSHRVLRHDGRRRPLRGLHRHLLVQGGAGERGLNPHCWCSPFLFKKSFACCCTSSHLFVFLIFPTRRRRGGCGRNPCRSLRAATRMSSTSAAAAAGLPRRPSAGCGSPPRCPAGPPRCVTHHPTSPHPPSRKINGAHISFLPLTKIKLPR